MITSCLGNSGWSTGKIWRIKGTTGASVMSANCSGDQARIKKVAKYAFFCTLQCALFEFSRSMKNVPEPFHFAAAVIHVRLLCPPKVA